MNNEDKLLSVLETLVSTVGKLEAGQARLEDTVGQMNDRLVNLETGQARLEDTVGQMNDRLMNVEDTVGQMNDRLVNVEDAVGRIEVEQVTMKEDIQFVRNTTTRIEQDHGRKLTALHDGYQQVYDKVTRLEDQVDTYENQPHLHLLPPKDKK